MRLLAIDTALENCSVGVFPGGGAPVLATETLGRGHAERLFGMIEWAMAEAGMSFDALDRIAVTIGPGSFTGVRVGIAAARGLALVTGAPVVGIGTLDGMAEAARALAGPGPVLALIDARRGEVYGQAFATDGAPLGPPEAASPVHFAGRIGRGMRLAGSGSALVAECAGGPAALIVHHHAAPDIAALVRLGLAAPAPVAPPRPLYLRPPDAKPQAVSMVARR